MSIGSVEERSGPSLSVDASEAEVTPAEFRQSHDASGTAGAVLGVIASVVFSRTLSWPTIIPPEWIVIAVVFSAFIGVFFGFYPARRASLLDPIEALRYE